jgi:pimeloyl-ACP methyl ester carboxylesterase
VHPTDTAAPLAVHVWGEGPRVVFVHGAMSAGVRSWERQRPLEARWQLVVPDRRGFGSTEVPGPSDFELESLDIAELLDDGAHLVGHSYGAIVAIFAAVRRPDAVRSLTVVEPPAHSLVRGNADIEAQIDHFNENRRPDITSIDFYRAFLERLGAPTDGLGDEVPPGIAANLQLLMTERPPWDLRIPVEDLRAAAIPTLIVTGGHQPMFELLGDTLAEALGDLAERATIAGRGHMVQRIGAPFNDRLEAFISAHGR